MTDHHRPLTDDAAVPHRTFFATGGLLGVLAAIYWLTAYEDGGTVLLVLAAVLAAWIGAYLWLRRQHLHTLEAGEPEAAAHDEAHDSIWPFVAGTGTSLVLLGFVLGLWLMAPGGALLALGIAGWTRR